MRLIYHKSFQKIILRVTWAIVSNRNCRYTSIFPSYRNQSNDLQCKSIKWFLHDGNILWFWCLYFLQWVYKSRVFLFDRETVVRKCFVKNVFLEVSKNSQENICARVSSLIKLQDSAQVFCCEFTKFLRTPFLQNTSGWLLLHWPISC